MKLAVLFWFYKDVDVCRDRLRLLRRYNPETPVFGLYGGDQSQADEFAARLSPYLDDFFSYPEGKSSTWKWLNGDLVLAEWFRRRGRLLSWDSVIVTQWDMLIFGRIREIFAGLKEGEVLLSSLRPVEEVAPWWYWIRTEPERYASFAAHVRKEYEYRDPLWCCQFVVVGLPRAFFESYAAVKAPECGFIEYRVPTYARIFGLPFCDSREFDCCWPEEPAARRPAPGEVTLSAGKETIPLEVICEHLSRRDGARVFHPFDRPFPLSAARALTLAYRLVPALPSLSAQLKKQARAQRRLWRDGGRHAQ